MKALIIGTLCCVLSSGLTLEKGIVDYGGASVYSKSKKEAISIASEQSVAPQGEGCLINTHVRVKGKVIRVRLLCVSLKLKLN